jgi:pimeloyl-ACP methyl ester carboxylesterase
MKHILLVSRGDRPLLRHAFGAAFIVGALFLGSCSTVKVKTSPDEVTEVALESADVLEDVVSAPFDALADFADETADLLKRAKRSEMRGKKSEAAGVYLKIAADAHYRLIAGKVVPGSEEEKALIEIYNSALAGFSAKWIEDPRRFEAGACRYACGNEEFDIALAPDSPYAASYFDHIIPSSGLQKKGIVNKTREGVGAALVAIREQRPDRGEEMRFFPGRGLHVPVTVTIDSISISAVDGGIKRVTFSLRNPLVEDKVLLGDRPMPLAADFSAPLAVVLRGGNEVISGIHGFFKADERLAHSGFLLLEPYDPNRIPVILIHGLFSVPIIWRDIIPEMTSDPEISRRYQFILFTYPSSYPVIQSSELLRDQIATLRSVYDPNGTDPLSRDLVVVGHSMGGILTHTLITEFGDNLWKEYSDVPFEELDLPAAEKEKIRKLVYFEPDPGVTRAIYYSTPHRGSNMAKKGLAGVISRTAKLPANVVQFTSNFLDPRIEAIAAVPAKEKVTSVQSLQPGSPMLSAMDRSPYKSGVTYHSIMGDRGRGDTPESSDGIVEYWSSRQQGAASELIVPSDHKSYRHPAGIAELHRILREHAGL